MQYGHFDNKQREYVIDRVDLPVSWTNYIGQNDLYGVFNHTAGGFVCGSSEYHRVIRFRTNGVPMDGPGHYIYLRDDDTGEYWTVSWQPVGRDKAAYSCRHGLGYVRYLSDYNGIHAQQTLFVAMDDPVELWDVALRNDSGRERHLSVFSYAEFSFHHVAMDNQNFQMSLYAAGSRYVDGVIEYELHYEENGYQFFTADFTPDGFDCLRDSFLGPYRTERDPIAVERGECSGSFENGGNHCAALHKRLTLTPGEETKLLYLLGEGGYENAKALRVKYTREHADEDFCRLSAFWDKKLSALQVETPNEGMNTELNVWNLYQSEINVMFSRFTSFIEVGGRVGLGYRDTAQDAMTIPIPTPKSAVDASWSCCARSHRRGTDCIFSSRAGLSPSSRSPPSAPPPSYRRRTKDRSSTGSRTLVQTTRSGSTARWCSTSARPAISPLPMRLSPMPTAARARCTNTFNVFLISPRSRSGRTASARDFAPTGTTV